MWTPLWSPCDLWGHTYELIGQDTLGHPVYRCARCQQSYSTWTSNGTLWAPTKGDES